jgi:DtxR family Mn-dependent transcriptional regulator
LLPSSTVENYLKTIYQFQAAQPRQGGLVPMGQIAAALGVVPGTATTMIKALSDSGLVRYEPYVGARLTSSGEKLAALVLRRHRLVELFLVEIMGMSWADVHEDAERLEHAVSERVIERMDEMLGHPETDPHGDPIPRQDGSIAQARLPSLLACPLDTPVIISRVVDQEASFLRFLEESDLKPGQRVRVEARDVSADSVRVRRSGSRRITLGTRAASKLLVELAR